MKPDNTVTVRVVTLGPGDAQNTSIAKGLEVGEMVVVDGADKLREGAAVTLPGAKPAADSKATDAKAGDAKPADGTKPEDAKQGDDQKGEHHHRHKDGQ